MTVAAERKSSPLADLGPALRRLRMGRGQRQFETAAAAEITKAMLSAYENGKRRPSLKTLDQILAALDADLGDLHAALVSERRERARAAGAARLRYPGAGRTPGAGDELGEAPAAPYGEPAPGRRADWPPPAWRGAHADIDLYHALGIQGPLPAGEERALSEMLLGFLKLLRYLHAGGGEGPAERRRGPFAG
jgi:transcriptional regulator with XRE-family HTH domain